MSDSEKRQFSNGEDRTGPDWAGRSAPAIEDIEAIVFATIDRLPDAFRAAAREVVLRVEDFAPDEILEEMELEDAFSLTGLYDGIPKTEDSVMFQRDRPDTIWLFRRPILDEWAERVDEPLGSLVAHVYVHELAHHLGWSDDDIAEVVQWWE
jgi:predicted Zn-dependent protease with MMP-like domain